jgi:hypothetical protein
MPTLILMYNIVVIHQERNMGKSIISTCMGFPGKTKDNMKVEHDLAELCNRSSLKLKVNGGKPHASFCLKTSTEERNYVVDEGVKIPRWL